MIKVSLDNNQAVLKAISRMSSSLSNPRPVFQDIGEYLVDSTKRRFADKIAPDGERWADNSLMTRIRKGRNDPLIGETKRLGREIHYRADSKQLLIGSALEYAAVQHFGARQGQFGKSSRNTPLPWGNIPARPFLGISEQDSVEILDIIKEHLQASTN